MSKFVLALDQGTTSSRAIVFDRSGKAVSSAQQEFPQIFPGPGHVEHNPEDIWSTQLATAKEAIAFAERWRPWRGAAACLLWSYYRVAKGRSGAPAPAVRKRNAARKRKK